MAGPGVGVDQLDHRGVSRPGAHAGEPGVGLRLGARGGRRRVAAGGQQPRRPVVLAGDDGRALDVDGGQLAGRDRQRARAAAEGVDRHLAVLRRERAADGDAPGGRVRAAGAGEGEPGQRHGLGRRVGDGAAPRCAPASPRPASRSGEDHGQDHRGADPSTRRRDDRGAASGGLGSRSLIGSSSVAGAPTARPAPARRRSRAPGPRAARCAATTSGRRARPRRAATSTRHARVDRSSALAWHQADRGVEPRGHPPVGRGGQDDVLDAACGQLVDRLGRGPGDEVAQVRGEGGVLVGEREDLVVTDGVAVAAADDVAQTGLDVAADHQDAVLGPELRALAHVRRDVRLSRRRSGRRGRRRRTRWRPRSAPPTPAPPGRSPGGAARPTRRRGGAGGRPGRRRTRRRPARRRRPAPSRRPRAGPLRRSRRRSER